MSPVLAAGDRATVAIDLGWGAGRTYPVAGIRNGLVYLRVPGGSAAVSPRVVSPATHGGRA